METVRNIICDNEQNSIKNTTILDYNEYRDLVKSWDSNSNGNKNNDIGTYVTTNLDSNTIRVEKTYWDKLTIIILLILTSDNGNNGRLLDECDYIELNNYDPNFDTYCQGETLHHCLHLLIHSCKIYRWFGMQIVFINV